MTTLLHAAALPSLDAALLARWAAVPTTITADLFKGRVLADPVVRPLRPFGSAARLAGRAVTACCEPPDFGCVLHAIVAAEPGDVIVIAARGHLETAMIGELLSGSARQKGVAGVVCDGAVRDVATLVAWPDFPVFTRGITARGPSSKDRGAVNAPAIFGGVPVNPGDVVIGDDDGLVFLSPADAAQAIAEAETRCAAEARWEKQLAAGATVVEVFDVPAAEQR